MEGIVSLVPSLTAIIIAIITKQVLPALIIGLIAGSYLVKPTILGGILQTTDYLIKSATVEENIEIVFFLYIFSGLIGMIKVTGGVKGVENLISKRIKSKKGVLLTTWGLSLFTFIDCGFHIMALGAIMKPIAKKINLAKERLAYVIDTATVPLIVLAPLGTTYVGYMVTLVRTSLAENNINQDPYSLFIKSIPYNFYAIVAILISLGVVITGKYFSIKKDTTKVKDKETKQHHHSKFKEDVEPKIWNIVFPILTLFILTLYFLWWSGSQETNSFLTALLKAKTARMMLVALLATLVITALFYIFQKFKIGELINGFLEGGNEIIVAMVLLFLVWGLAEVSNDLGFSQFITNTLGTFLPGYLVPSILFLLGSIVSYFIGTSWGAWGLLMPMGISLAIATNSNLALSVGAVFAGGTFGDHISPLSETTVITATIMKMPVVKHANNQLLYGITGVVISSILYLIAGILL
ncbi:Na+/H+ antiporter [Halobacteroides halobius DSM 5150]|uniref:Na+/H+ antiporter n=1 Tax=Halobacteroides halobius (strain ATCC 35273 / DSM 5150 / MD-1) TaxID=748449 RepID=L0KCD3_HALHC|nr:Na+/H+ antiporter NhaC family protein [Halobacteroides halobius]AGB42210.1 Na+/H+ antiporter [Halobacteroides halobius DSM 5150]